MAAFGKNAVFCSLLAALFSLVTADNFNMDEDCGMTYSIGVKGGTLKSQSGYSYDNNIDCTIALTADAGRRILLTFENKVDLEGCGSDYLEIYDNSFNKDTLLSTICESYPSDVTSSSRSMTLRFKTDNSVTNTGFLLAYTSYSYGPCNSNEFTCDNRRCIDADLRLNSHDNCGDNSDEILNMNEECGRTILIRDDGGTLKSQSGYRYDNNMDCTMTFTAKNGRRVLLTFENKVDLEGCGTDYLEIYDGYSKRDTLLSTICNSYPSDVTSSSSSITLRLKTDNVVTNTGFLLAYTSYGYVPCKSIEFTCDNKRCIDTDLRFNSHDNCGDNSDEFDNRSWSTGLIIGVSAACLVAFLLFVLCIGCICCLVCKSSRSPAQHSTTVTAQAPMQTTIPMQPAVQATGQPAPHGQFGQPGLPYGQAGIPYGQPGVPYGQPVNPYGQAQAAGQPPTYDQQPPPYGQMATNSGQIENNEIKL